jgi:hypothetical protein
MRLFGSNERSEALIAIYELLDSIFSGKESILFSSKTGFTLTYDLDAGIKDQDEDEEMTIYKLNDL